MASTVDEAILRNKSLSGPNQQALAERRMRQNGNGEKKQEGRYQSLRQKMAAARSAVNLKQKARDKIEDKKLQAQMALGKALKIAQMLTIPTLFISQIYVAFHVFSRYALSSKIFCPLGEENDNNKAFYKIWEPIKLFIFLIAAFVIWYMAMGFIVIILSFIEDPLESIFNLGWSSIQVLVDLFKDSISN